MNFKVFIKWAMQESNLRPPACKAGRSLCNQDNINVIKNNGVVQALRFKGVLHNLALLRFAGAGLFRLGVV
jgi:hypothetical protein